MPNDAKTSNTLRVLFLCTHNSNRSQMAEAIFSQKIKRLPPGRYLVASAGSTPSDQVNPWALRTLTAKGIDWRGHKPKSIDSIYGDPWDLVITVCDKAKETCPVMPGQPAFAHWGMDDPSEADESSRERAYNQTFAYLSRRIDLLLALPFEKLEKRALELKARQIAEEVPVPRGALETDAGSSR